MHFSPPTCRERSLVRVIVQRQLKGFEFARDIFLDAVPFSGDNDLLTPTFKLKRNVAKEHYQEAIDRMYASGLGVVAGE